jgi:RND family efflux transporter MFP subunit
MSQMKLPLIAALLVTTGPLAPAAAAEFIVKATTVVEMKAVFGQVESRTVVPARARIGGTITELKVSEGDQVAAGEVIAVVIDDKIPLELRAAVSKINALSSQLENARTEVERVEELLAKGVAAQSRLDATKLQLEVVTNQLAAAEAEKAVIEQRAREGNSLAPASGRVLTVPVTPGSVILPGEEIARIATGRYYLRLSLPERHASEIAAGDEVAIGERGLVQSADDPAMAHSGRIAKVYPEIANGRVIADVEVANVGDYYVNERTLVSIPVGKRSVLAVPLQAVKTLHGVDYVGVVTENGVTDVAVILGDFFMEGDGRRVEVLTGLRDGDRIALP